MGYSIFTHCSFDESKNKLNYYRGDDCNETFSKNLREHSTKILNYEKKKIILLTPEEKKIMMIKKYAIYAKKNLIIMILIKKVTDHCHYTGKYKGAAHNICNLR